VDPTIGMGIVLVISLFILLASGVWIAVALVGVGYIAITFFSDAPGGSLMASALWGALSDNWAITALPLFIWMAEILNRTRLANDMFNGLAPLLVNLPGRLLHVNIIGCGILAAVSGSSAATVATIAKITVPELEKRNYDEKMTICTLAGSGTLGLLIPPSVVLIVYGFVTVTSIARLFIAGVGPGIMLIFLFMGYTVLWALLHPDRVPFEEIKTTLWQKILGTRRLIPVALLIVLVIGSIYAGIATPTESAAFGVAGALLLSAVFGSFTWTSFKDSLSSATRVSCFCLLIIAGAAYLSMAMSFTGIPAKLATFIIGQEYSTYGLIAVLTVLYLILGCFLEGFSMIVLTMGVLQPIIEGMGIDLIWYGIFMVIVIEAEQLTPPVGFNLFVLQQFTGKNVFFIAKAAFPFFCCLMIGLVLLTIFPEIALYLPTKMLAR